MANFMAYVALSVFAGIGAAEQSGIIVGACVAGAYILGRLYG